MVAFANSHKVNEIRNNSDKNSQKSQLEGKVLNEIRNNSDKNSQKSQLEGKVLNTFCGGNSSSIHLWSF